MKSTIACLTSADDSGTQVIGVFYNAAGTGVGKSCNTIHLEAVACVEEENNCATD